MTSEPPPDGDVTRWLEPFRLGDPAARDRLIEYTYGRFERLTSQMLDGFPALRRWEQTGDVLNTAMIRLMTALEKIQPESSAHFLRLAALQIRRELHDLVRHHFGPHGMAANQDATGGSLPASSADWAAPAGEGPSTLAQWTEFHEAVAGLPAELLEVVDLHWYQGLTHEQVAVVVGVDGRTIKRRWRAARQRLADRPDGLPGGDKA